MSAKQLARLAMILGVLLLVWGAAALARRKDSTASGERLRLPRITRSETDTVTITRAKDTAVLIRKDSTAWSVNGHPASSTAITELFTALSDSAAATELVAERKSSHAGMGVDTAGTRARFVSKGKTLAELIVGNRSSDFSAGYLRLADQEPTYLMKGQLTEILTRPPEEWREHRIAKVAADSIARIEVSRGRRSYTLQRKDKAWELASGSAADSTTVGDLLTAYSSVEATGFATPAEANSARFASPDRRTRLMRKDGTALLTLVFDSTQAGFWVRPDTGQTVYRIEQWTADRLAPADSAVRAKGAKAVAR